MNRVTPSEECRDSMPGRSKQNRKLHIILAKPGRSTNATSPAPEILQNPHLLHESTLNEHGSRFRSIGY